MKTNACSFGHVGPLLAVAAIIAATAAAQTQHGPSTTLHPADPLGGGGSLESRSGGIALVSVIGGSLQLAPFAGGTVEIRTGFLGQGRQVTSFPVAADPERLDEGGSGALVPGEVTFDDGSVARPGILDIHWAVKRGPVQFAASGTVTAGRVTADTPAEVQAAFDGTATAAAFTVANIDPDDYGDYAGDGLDDAFQLGFFGEPPNPLAAPEIDPDGDSQSNRFEFLAGLDPTDCTSRFALRLARDPVQPGHALLTFGPMMAGRAYVVAASPDLSPGSWAELVNPLVNDEWPTRTVTDTSPPMDKKFYRVNITKP